MEIGRRVIYKVSGEALRGKFRINVDLLMKLIYDHRNDLSFANYRKVEYFESMLEKRASELVCVPSNIDEEMVEIICSGAKDLHDAEKEVIIVPGSGNLWRGRQKDSQMDAIKADQIGMLGINMNALAIGEKLDRMNIANKVVSCVPVEEFGIDYNEISRYRKNLSNGEVLIIGGGTGSPLCTSDSATVKAAHEYHADTILFGKSIDGIYDKDPRKYRDANKYKYLTYDKLVEDQLQSGVANQGVMDFEAMARLLKMPIDLIVYQANDQDAIRKILAGDEIGTVIKKKIKKIELYKKS